MRSPVAAGLAHALVSRALLSATVGHFAQHLPKWSGDVSGGYFSTKGVKELLLLGFGAKSNDFLAVRKGEQRTQRTDQDGSESFEQDKNSSTG